MGAIVVEKRQRLRLPVLPDVKPEKKSFEEACVECNAAPLEIFIDELKKRVKKRYQNAKG